MPRFKLTGDPCHITAALAAKVFAAGVAVRRVTARDAHVVVDGIDREDAGYLRRAWAACQEIQPQHYLAAVVDEVRAVRCWYGDCRDTLQAAIADASQYAVRRYVAGGQIPDGSVLAVVCYYDLDDAEETFTLAARYTPDEGGWVEVL